MSQATAAAPAPTRSRPRPRPLCRGHAGTDRAPGRGDRSGRGPRHTVGAHPLAPHRGLGVLAFTALTVAQLVLGMNAASRAAADADQVIRIQDLKVDLPEPTPWPPTPSSSAGWSRTRSVPPMTMRSPGPPRRSPPPPRPSLPTAALAELSSRAAIRLRHGGCASQQPAGPPRRCRLSARGQRRLARPGMTLVESLLDANTARAKASLDDQHPLWVAIPRSSRSCCSGSSTSGWPPFPAPRQHRDRHRRRWSARPRDRGCLGLGEPSRGERAPQFGRVCRSGRCGAGAWRRELGQVQREPATGRARLGQDVRGCLGQDATAVRDTMPGESDDAWSA